ncbi:hypothetical protein [Streptomyces sp. NPDC050504]|uniref:hypothetical protein n=1 Tax=Streptomyces sp. NPDC050504 TaxID=3365618 RepID=UPI00379C12E2
MTGVSGCARCGGVQGVRVVAYVDAASGPPRAVHACEEHRAVLGPPPVRTTDPSSPRAPKHPAR